MSETQFEILGRVAKAFEKLQKVTTTTNTDHINIPLSAGKNNNLFVRRGGDGHLILFLRSTETLARATKLPKSRDWFAVYPEKWKEDAPGVLNLVIELIDSECIDLFESLAAFVVRAVASVDCAWYTDRKKREAPEFNRSLKRWCRENPESDEPMGPKRQRGLHAELWFLREYIVRTGDPSSDLKSWVGPSGADHDFHFPRFGVEVKAVAASDEEPEVQISNEYQLDPKRRSYTSGTSEATASADLFLFCLSLRDSENTSVGEGGELGPQAETLFALVESLRAPLGTAWTQFRSKLARAGYRKRHEKEYKIISRAVINSGRPRLFKVADKGDNPFPRIIRSGGMSSVMPLHPAIRKVKYYLKVTELVPFACANPDTEAAFIAALRAQPVGTMANGTSTRRPLTLKSRR